jgi:hypothetical protein
LRRLIRRRRIPGFRGHPGCGFQQPDTQNESGPFAGLVFSMEQAGRERRVTPAVVGHDPFIPCGLISPPRRKAALIQPPQGLDGTCTAAA